MFENDKLNSICYRQGIVKINGVYVLINWSENK